MKIRRPNIVEENAFVVYADEPLISYNYFDRRYVEERWLPVIGFEKLYEVSDFGRVRALERRHPGKRGGMYIRRSKIIKTSILKRTGYVGVTLRDKKIEKHYLLHRLVAIHFIKNGFNKKEVNHISGNKTDNRYFNLEWVTSSENKKHAFSLGLLCQKGERHASNKLNNEDVVSIFSSKLPVEQLANQYGVSANSIYNIRSGLTWGHTTGAKYKKANRLTREGVIGIFNSKSSCKKLSEEYGVAESTIYKIKKGYIYNQITKPI